MGNMTKALKFSEKSLNILKKNYGEDCLYLVSSYEKIGNIYKEIHNWTKALQFFLKCVEITIKNLNIS
jgi:tetratricopeptide (TPR) repeat protein